MRLTIRSKIMVLGISLVIITTTLLGGYISYVIRSSAKKEITEF